MPATDRMPTAARLVSALILAALAWAASQFYRPLMPEATDFGWFNEVNAGVGALCGWYVTGPRLGRGWPEGIGAGLTGVAALVFWVLFLHSFNEMLGRALETRYNGPIEAILAIFSLAADYGALMLEATLLGLLVAGGLILGLVGEWVSHRWS